MKMVYDEWYGDLSYAQRAAYRKHNVTPYEHDRLVETFGQSAHAEITKGCQERHRRTRHVRPEHRPGWCLTPNHCSCRVVLRGQRKRVG